MPWDWEGVYSIAPSQSQSLMWNLYLHSSRTVGGQNISILHLYVNVMFLRTVLSKAIKYFCCRVQTIITLTCFLHEHRCMLCISSYIHLSLFYLMIAFYVPTNRRQLERYGLFLHFCSVEGPKMDGIKALSPSEISGSFYMQYIFISPSYVIYWTEIYWTKLKLWRWKAYSLVFWCMWVVQFLALDAWKQNI